MTVTSWGARALEHLSAGNRIAAIDDLVEAEATLDQGPVDAPEHVRLGLAYQQLRLYELALPHLRAAGTPDTAHLLVDLLLTWADELQQSVGLDPDTRDEHAALAAAAHSADALAEIRAMAADEQPDAGKRAVMEEGLLAADPQAVRGLLDPPSQVAARFVVRGHAARAGAHLVTGDLSEARRHGTVAVQLAATRVVDPVTARSAYFALHRAEYAAGLPGAMAAAAVIVENARQLWRQRTTALSAIRLRRDTARLVEQRVAAEQLARRDPLTGLANRRALTDWHSARPAGPMVMVMADLDDFKEVNDTYGHLTGDEVLVRVADYLRSRFPGMVICRYGGDEFVLADDSQGVDAAALATAVERAVEDVAVDGLVDAGRIRCTVGWAAAEPGAPTLSLLAAADHFLLDLKRAGRR